MLAAAIEHEAQAYVSARGHLVDAAGSIASASIPRGSLISQNRSKQRMARTLADLDGRDALDTGHVAEALQYRQSRSLGGIDRLRYGPWSGFPTINADVLTGPFAPAAVSTADRAYIARMARSKSRRAVPSSLQEVSMFHMRKGDVFETVRRLAARLHEEHLDYVVIGGLAVSELGYARATVDVDILLRPEGLEAFRERCVGRGYVPAFPGATKCFKDAQTGIRIEILTTGEFPGDGKPKPVAFPDPADAGVEGEDFRYLKLEPLLELKLASGSTAPHRLRDLADVQDLIVALGLGRDLAERLDPSVRDAYRRLWDQSRTQPR
jgi:hypothetical protein